MSTRLVTALLAAVLAVALPDRAPAFQKELKTRQDQLEKLRKEIDQYERKIRDREKKESATLEKLDDYGRQETLLRKLVKKLHDEEADLERSIASTRTSVGDLTDRIERLRTEYAAYVRSAYRRGPGSELELLAAAGSVNQLIIRAEYLRRFTARRKADLAEIAGKRRELETEQDRLAGQLRRQQTILSEKSKEQSNLKRNTRRKKDLLSGIRRDKKNFQKELDRRRKDSEEIARKIAALIEAERKRKEAAGGRAPAAPGGGAFEALQGGLGWPVTGGRLMAGYGRQKHPVLNTVTENNGVDISVPLGTAVSAVAPGEVSTIWWLPSFGNLVIVAHEGGYRTVYAHLGDVDVEEGQKVASGQTIGRSGEGLAGPMIHFEVWRGRESLDPERWLRTKGITRN